MTDVRIPLTASVCCPYCGQHTRAESSEASASMPFVQIAAAMKGLPIGTGVNYVVAVGLHQWWIAICNGCHGVMLVRNSGDTVLPPPQPEPVAQSIPEPMRSDLQEAKRCITVNAWNAAVVMARRALQCAAVQQEAPTGKAWPLWKQIAWLDENRKITPTQRQLADAARWVGNHGAHDTEPDVAAGQPVITNVTDGDARDTIQLVEHLFETLYVAPKMAEAQLAKRGKLSGGPQK